jgi:hypothetical protein
VATGDSRHWLLHKATACWQQHRQQQQQEQPIAAEAKACSSCQMPPLRRAFNSVITRGSLPQLYWKDPKALRKGSIWQLLQASAS